MKSPCYACPRLQQDKRLCSETCEALSEYQQQILEKEPESWTMRAINYETDIFREPTESLENPF